MQKNVILGKIDMELETNDLKELRAELIAELSKVNFRITSLMASRSQITSVNANDLDTALSELKELRQKITAQISVVNHRIASFEKARRFKSCCCPDSTEV